MIVILLCLKMFKAEVVLTGASIVVFPVDCIDHDSASNLKKLCARHGVPFLPLRTASVTSFASALAAVTPDDANSAFPLCIRHA